jgi:hypothetical protein
MFMNVATTATAGSQTLELEPRVPLSRIPMLSNPKHWFYKKLPVPVRANASQSWNYAVLDERMLSNLFQFQDLVPKRSNQCFPMLGCSKCSGEVWQTGAGFFKSGMVLCCAGHHATCQECGWS